LRLVQISFALIALCPCFSRAALTWDSRTVSVTAKSEDQKVSALFRFRNTGAISVAITKVQPGCGCTTTELAKSTYAPGEEGSLRAIFTIGEREGLEEKHIEVTTSDSPTTPVMLVMRIDILKPLTRTPQLLLWRQDTEVTEKAITIAAAGGHRITAIEVKKVTPDEAAARVEQVEAGVKYRILVRPTSLSKPLSAVISCVASFEDRSAYPFSVYALVK
jgi:phage tail sheath protein FI